MLWRQTKQAREIGSSVCVGGAGRTQLALERSLGGEEGMGPEDVWGKMALDRGKSECKGSQETPAWPVWGRQGGQCGWSQVSQGELSRVRGNSGEEGSDRGWSMAILRATLSLWTRLGTIWGLGAEYQSRGYIVMLPIQQIRVLI